MGIVPTNPTPEPRRTELAAILRRDAGETVTVPRPYMTALTLIRALARTTSLDNAELVDEIRGILAALLTIQAELDEREAGR